MRTLLEKLFVQSAGYSKDDCWEWPGYKDKDGYGRTHVDGKHITAHAAMYIMIIGPIPNSLILDHVCNNTSCVNPWHLEPKTQRENVLRSKTGLSANNARKTACKDGHPFDEKNTRYKHGPYGVIRTCRICAAIDQNKRRANDPEKYKKQRRESARRVRQQRKNSIGEQ
jgi:hypothetical protein